MSIAKIGACCFCQGNKWLFVAKRHVGFTAFNGVTRKRWLSKNYVLHEVGKKRIGPNLLPYELIIDMTITMDRLSNTYTYTVNQQSQTNTRPLNPHSPVVTIDVQETTYEHETAYSPDIFTGEELNRTISIELDPLSEYEMGQLSADITTLLTHYDGTSELIQLGSETEAQVVWNDDGDPFDMTALWPAPDVPSNSLIAGSGIVPPEIRAVESSPIFFFEAGFYASGDFYVANRVLWSDPRPNCVRVAQFNGPGDLTGVNETVFCTSVPNPTLLLEPSPLITFDGVNLYQIRQIITPDQQPIPPTGPPVSCCA
jgi:hypothetical protein